ncbi:sensor domain-containing protein [Kiloniella sp. b19]|uniref:sensor domain-containing protein n=1 Tax=Kiloniella sp. GXU_MW_B19 TaxID=3141326 RepID=UPI0031DBB01A
MKSLQNDNNGAMNHNEEKQWARLSSWVLVISSKGLVQFANSAALEGLGYRQEGNGLLGKSLKSLVDDLHSAFCDNLDDLMETAKGRHLLRFITQSGQGRLVYTEVSKAQHGECVLSCEPVLSAEEELNPLVSKAGEISRDFSINLVCVFDAETIYSVNPEGLKFLGLKDKADAQSHKITDFIHQDYHSLFQGQMEVWRDESELVPVRLKSLEGEELSAQVFVSCFEMNGQKAWVMEASNRITSQLREEELMAIQLDLQKRFEKQQQELREEKSALQRARDDLRLVTFQDGLTGLGNRKQFLQQLDFASLHASGAEPGMQGDWRFAVLQLDLDNFKNLNSSFGHDLCDDLLNQIGLFITSMVPDPTDCARIGGDVFALVAEIEDTDDGLAIARRLLDRFEKPFSVDGHEIYCGCSIGISVYPDHARSAEDLLGCSEVALEHAKKKGSGSFEIYTDGLGTRGLNLGLLESDLRKAIREGDFEIHYQPQIDLKTGQTIGGEALTRWYHPEQGYISPEIFIPLAERSGLIDALTDWVLTTACVQIKEWQVDYPGLRVAVNLSSVSFRQRDFDQKIREVLEFTRVPPECLELEITETALMHDFVEADLMLRKLADLGVGLSIDDFGTGYSSLSYLKRFPVNKLKIDKSFVMHSHENSDDAALTSAVISIAKAMGIKVLAEGVECPEHYEFLADQGCDEAQGFLFARPIPAEDFIRWCVRKEDEKLAVF